MPAYSGKFQYTDESGGSLNQGLCQVSFDRETCVVTPAGDEGRRFGEGGGGSVPAATALAFDLGDIDRVAPGEWDLQLTLYTGRTVTLKQFGAAFSNMSGELLAAWRDRTIECLLLEDLEELGRYPGTANGTPAEIRLFRSNLAILPQAATPVQWRLADIDSLRFDNASYSIVMMRGGERLVLSKLARKTDEFFGKLQEALTALREHAAAALHGIFPFLSADQLARLLEAMPEGRSAPLNALNGIHPKLGEALIAHAVDEPLKPYFDALRSRATADPLLAGFKFVRPNESEPGEVDAADTPAAQPQGTQPLFFWFFFPLPGGLAAWEATTGSGRATYFFRAPAPVADAVARLTRGLALVNFRREPVYLPEASLEGQQRFHRYAIGARKLADLRSLRAAFAGRAIHSSLEAWQGQVESMMTGT